MDLSKSGERIREMRKKKGLTQTELASKLLGINTDRGKSKISEYEHGKNLTLKNIQELAKALECDPDYLLGSIEHPDTTTSWIAEKIPLSRDAIEKLISINTLENREQYLNVTVAIDFIDALITAMIPDVTSSGSMEINDKKGWLVSAALYNLKQAYEANNTLQHYSDDELMKMNKEDYEKFRSFLREKDLWSLAIDGNKQRLSIAISDIIDEYMRTTIKEV